MIGNHVVRLTTHPPVPIPEENCRESIIARSRKLYCRPVDEVRRAVRNRRTRWIGPVAPSQTEDSVNVDSTDLSPPDKSRLSDDDPFLDEATNYDTF